MGMIHSQDWRGGDENLQKPLSITEEVQICAPQLLHMAYDGSPLWFNGWILENKFEQENAKFQNFECYMREPREITDPEAWTMGQSNKCCLSGLQTFEFTKEEKQTLKTIFQFAVDAGASSSNIK
jgi:alpha 1,3-mannosyltransferase